MNLPDEFYQIIILVIAISVVWTFVTYFTKTKSDKNFRSRRNKRVRRQS